MDQRTSSYQVTARLSGGLAERTEEAAARLFQGKEAMLIREALTVYLDLRDALGFDFDRTIQPLRDPVGPSERELAAAS